MPDYVTFSILPSGAWVYTLDTANPAIAALVMGEQLMDTVQIPSVDDTWEDI